MNITALLGAGAFLDVDGKSTPFLTQKVIDKITEIKVNSLCKHSEPFLKNVADKLDEYWKPDTCNFEEIYHTIEMLFSYRYYGEGKPFRPPLGAFINRHEYFFKYEYLKKSLMDIIKVIGDHVKEYDNKFQPDGAHKWFADFWRKAISITKWNIATLNYDTCIEKSIVEYEDGYRNTQTEIGRYVNPPSEYIKCYEYSSKSIRESVLPKIMHLHGSILYGYPLNRGQYFDHDNNDLYKFESYCEAEKSWDRMPFMQKQGLETTITGPIITGLGKTDKLLCYPYIDYSNLFYESLFNSNGLLIAGYSFGDIYINKMLDRFAYLRRPKKIVLITQQKEDDLKWTGSLSGMEEFILRINKEKPFGNNSLLPPPAVSLDGSIQLYISGMRDAIENHGDEILKFLTS